MKGNVQIDKLSITKSLSDGYKDPSRIAHAVLAQRMGKRDPNNKPKPGDRIEFVFMLHSEKSIQIQLGNVIMSSAWYIFFSVCSSIYYFTNVKLIQRTESINDWLLDMKQTHPTIENFYKVYDSHYTSIRRFAANWNFIILSFHIPFDLISVIYDKNYLDIFGTIVKSLALIWYLFCICSLNNCETKIISYLYKYRIFTLYHMKSIEQYMIYRPIGLNFYGIKINTTTIMKITIISFNLLIPTIYAIVKNFIKDLPTSS